MRCNLIQTYKNIRQLKSESVYHSLSLHFKTCTTCHSTRFPQVPWVLLKQCNLKILVMIIFQWQQVQLCGGIVL